VADLLVIVNPRSNHDVGDIIDVRPNGKLKAQNWVGSRFYVLRVANLSYDDALQYADPWDSPTGKQDEKGNATFKRIKSRLWHVPNDLDSGRNGLMVMPWNKARVEITNKDTGQGAQWR